MVNAIVEDNQKNEVLSVAQIFSASSA
jgi:hypothetical protein